MLNSEVDITFKNPGWGNKSWDSGGKVGETEIEGQKKHGQDMLDGLI